MLMERCGEGFWTGDPDIVPTGEGQLGVFSTLGLEIPANLPRKHRGCIGERVGRPLLRRPWLLREPPAPNPPAGWNSWKSQGPLARPKEEQLGDLVVSNPLPLHTHTRTPGLIWVHRGVLAPMTHNV